MAVGNRFIYSDDSYIEKKSQTPAHPGPHNTIDNVINVINVDIIIISLFSNFSSPRGVSFAAGDVRIISKNVSGNMTAPDHVC